MFKAGRIQQKNMFSIFSLGYFSQKVFVQLTSCNRQHLKVIFLPAGTTCLYSTDHCIFHTHTLTLFALDRQQWCVLCTLD